MKHFKLQLTAAIALQLCIASASHAQLIEDIDTKSVGNNAVTQIRFVAPVQFQRSVVAKSGDLVQIFYNITPNVEVTPTVTGERRTLSGNGLPEMVVTDEAVSRDNINQRKLLIRFITPTKFKVRAGPSSALLELVLEGWGDKVKAAPTKPPPKTVDQEKYYVVLQRSIEPGLQLNASVPSEFQDSEVFSSSSVSEGKLQYEINLGFFKTLAQAQSAQKTLAKRFPSASVSRKELPPASLPPQIPVQDATTGTPDSPTTTASPTPTGDSDAEAAKLMTLADAANDRGDYADAIAALDSLLGLPPNQKSRLAQEQIGVTRLKSGDNDRARGEFETFLKLYPEGEDSERVKQFLKNLPIQSAVAAEREPAKPQAVVSGSLSTFYFGGQSQTRSQDFADSPLSGLPVLLSESNLAGVDQKQMQTNIDLNRRYRDTEVDQRFVFRNTYSQDMMPNRPNKNRLSALYFDNRSLTNGTSFRIGRQSPTGGGVLYRFDGAQVGYTFAPKWKLNAVYGVPTDPLLDTKRNFYGAWVDAEALAPNTSGSLYVNQQMIDNEVDRRALGTELRYFNEGVALSGQLDYDQMLQGINIAAIQGSWQWPDNTQFNILLDRRATPVRALGNILFFQDPMLAAPARNIQDLLGTTPIDMLRGQVNGITSFQNQAMAGFTTPLSEHWQTGGTVNYTNVDEIKPVAVILPQGQASTGDLWSVGVQLIGLNLYSSLDTHIFSANFLSGPTYKGTMLSYNNMTAFGEALRIEPSLRFYTQVTSTGDKTNRLSPGLRLTYRIMNRLSLESELSMEFSETKGAMRNETSQRMFYYVGLRLDL
jgi:tetratricopeptide (TPR) repeat protein